MVSRVFIEESKSGLVKIFKVSILLTITCCTLGIMAFTNYSIIERAAYAADNCDFTSTCTNTQTGIDNSQTNDCTNFSTCINDGRGAGNTQSNLCDSVSVSGCSNFANGDTNNQIINCKVVNPDACSNFAVGDDNSQKYGLYKYWITRLC